MKCYKCGRVLPEPGATHIAYMRFKDPQGYEEERPVCQNELHGPKAKKLISRLECVSASTSSTEI